MFWDRRGCHAACLVTEELQRLPRLVAWARADMYQTRILGLAERAAEADGVDAVVADDP